MKPEEELKLQAALAAFPELRTAYLLKERFAAIANRIPNRLQHGNLPQSLPQI